MAGRRIGYSPERQRISSRQLEHREVESDAIASLEYDVENEQCTVVFNKRGTYCYFGVPPYVFAEFNGAGSRGVYLNLYIKGFYEYERIA